MVTVENFMSCFSLTIIYIEREFIQNEVIDVKLSLCSTECNTYQKLW